SVYIYGGLSNEGNNYIGNIAFHEPLLIDWKDMGGGFYFRNAFNPPSGDPTGGAFMYVNNDDSHPIWITPSGELFDLTEGGITITEVMDSISNAIDTLVTVTQMMDSISSAGGGIGGSIANTQVAFGDASGDITGSN